MPTERDPDLEEALTRAARDLPVGTPDYRNRVRSTVARRVAVGVAGVGLAAVAVVGLLAIDRGDTTDVATSPTSSVTEPRPSLTLSLSPTAGSFHPGETIRVTGSGCPPNGTVPVQGAQVGVRLGPDDGGPGWGVSNGSVMIANSLMYVPGVVNAATTSATDGSWAVDVAVPTDAPSSDGYRVSVLCATRLTIGQSGHAVEPDSLESATVASGPITIGPA